MRRSLALTLIAGLLIGGCGDEGDGEEPSAGTTTAPAEAADQKPAGQAKHEKAEERPKPGTEITIAPSQFGEIVFDGNNQAIYLFDKETTSKPQCYGECAAAWPPVLTQGEPVASGAADQKLLGTTNREDGTTQVTYAGQPLYYYAHEEPGQVLCHNVEEFGGLWLVVDANGDALP